MKPNTGSSLLVTVFIIATLLGLVLMSLVSLLLLETKRSVGITKSHQLFYAMEGAFLDTVYRLKNDPVWKVSDTIVNEIQIGDALVKRQIRKDEATGGLSMSIKADLQGIRRQVESSYFRGATSETGETTRPPLDIMLVLDRSGSLGNKINDVKNAAKALVFSESLNSDDAIGMVSFSYPTVLSESNYEAHLDGLLIQLNSTSKNILSEKIDSLTDDYPTNIENGLKKAHAELSIHSTRDEAVPIIILFSDGVPNLTTDRNSMSSVCGNYPCMRDLSNPLLPMNPETGNYGGTQCTNDTIVTSDTIKNNSLNGRNIRIFTVFLNNISNSDCIPSDPTADQRSKAIEKTALLGRQTLQSIASPDSFYETFDSKELIEIFQSVVHEITGGSVKYQEVDPEETF